MSSLVEFEVNGESVAVNDEPELSLLLALRNDLGLRGVRAGCSIGECGSCMVIIDGEAKQSCQIPVGSARDSRVLTPEGLGTPSDPHPVQKVFLEQQAAQCGYCINGIEMTVAAWLDGSAPDIEKALSSHICRCGAQPRILAAVARLAAGPESMDAAVSSDDAGFREPAQRTAEGDGDRPLRVDEDVSTRLRLREGGIVEVLTGKVELGQGIETAFAQIAAAGVGVPLERISLASVDTDTAPDDGNTSASASVQLTGPKLAIAAAEFRRILLARAAGIAGAEHRVEVAGIFDDRVIGSDGLEIATLDELAEMGAIEGMPDHPPAPDWSRQPIGSAPKRTDLVKKLTGSAAYVHDLQLEGMVHARALLPPTYGAKLLWADIERAEGSPGVLGVVQIGSIVVVLTEREEHANRSVRTLAGSARWEESPVNGDLNPYGLRELDGDVYVARHDSGVDEVLTGQPTLKATYSKPYQAHAPMAPSCAVALFEPSQLTVWTHSQGIHALKREIRATLDLPSEFTVTVNHVAGPGCYGFNCADDVAVIAATVAIRTPGVPVRFQFTMEDEFRWDPFGPAMTADLEAAWTSQGTVAAWAHETTTGAHNARPDGTGSRLMTSWAAHGLDLPWGGATESGARNIVPVYDYPLIRSAAKHVRGGLRTGELRSLGAFFNVFAAESFVDELAEHLGQDPVEFRLSHTADPRAKEVLAVAAEEAGWERRVGPSGRGWGISVARYRDAKAYVAQAICVEVDEELGVVPLRVVTVCDAGTVINPDGVRNQLDGGTMQALSRTLKEKITADHQGIQSTSWLEYEVWRFAQVPEFKTILINRQGAAPLGVGEATMGPAAAACANAVDDAIGIRMRDLPITIERIRERLGAMSTEEEERVRL